VALVSSIFTAQRHKGKPNLKVITKQGGKMPLVEVKVFQDELTVEQTKDLIQKITDAVTTVTSEKLRDVTWVIINEVKSGNWGGGGKALGLQDVKKMIGS
jgi:4-oxalocrotonate tautomerase